MRRAILAAVLLAGPILSAGCVERRFVVQSDPPGATAFVNGHWVGATPVSVPFVYYGDYDITLAHEGFETLRVKQNVAAPIYEYFPLDFFSENVYPFHIQDNRAFTFRLLPAQQPRSDVLLERAEQLRQRGRQLPGDPPPPPPTTSPQLIPPSTLPAEPPLPAPRPRNLTPSDG